MRAASATLITMLSAQAMAGGVFTPFSLDSAAVMPKGVRSVRLTGFTTEIGTKYDTYGSMVPLANGFNKKVTWGELIDSQPAGFERGKFVGGLESMGIGMDQEAGDARGIVDVRLTTTVPVLAYGITEKITLGIGLPIVYTNLNVSTGWQASPAFEAQLATLSNNGFHNRVLSYRDQLNNVVATKLSNYKYELPQNESRTEIGDLNVGGKYQIYKDMRWQAALAPKIVVPTGRTANVNKIVDPAPGDGQPDFGLGGVVEYSPHAKVSFYGSTSYTYQVASTKAKRVPISPNETATPDIDHTIQEKIGDIMTAGLGLRWKAAELVSFGLGGHYLYKPEDQYSGSRYPTHRYAWMSKDTEQKMVAGTLGLTFSTIPLFLAKKFPVPLEASVNLSRVFSGQNVGIANLAAFELAAFF